MKVAIIGAGFVGLSAGYELIKRGHEVTIFEAGDKVGGLAVGFKSKEWSWSLEKFYHHFFTNDEAIISLADEIGVKKIISTPKTNSFVFGKEVQLDSPISLLKFPYLSILDRIRMGAGLLLFKLIPNGTFLEKWTTDKALPLILGKKGYEMIWKPLLSAKFGPFTEEVNLAWFWARVFKRTTSLGYFEGGFQALADKLAEKISDKGGKIVLNKKVSSSEYLVSRDRFDAWVITVPAPLVDKLIGPKIKWPKINYLWGQTVVLELNQSLMKGYWLNILEKNWPFLVVVEHTNFVDKENYGGNVLVYLGNYLPDGDKKLVLKDEDLLDLYLPFLKKINRDFSKAWIKRLYRFKEPFAQPVFRLGIVSNVSGQASKTEICMLRI
jgi:protoporphyrinogen oxidase